MARKEDKAGSDVEPSASEGNAGTVLRTGIGLRNRELGIIGQSLVKGCRAGIYRACNQSASRSLWLVL